MILNTFTRLASLALYLLSSGFLAANDEPFLMSFETANKQIKTASKASPSSQDDPLLSAFEKQRDEALTKAQEGKATLAQQARQIEAMKKLLAEKNAAETEAQEVEARLAQQAQEMADLMALLNPSPKPKPSVVPALSTPVKPSASVASSSATASASIPRSLDIAIPEVARGYEEVYRRFLGGKLIYTDPSSKAKTELPIRALSNPLEGTFDLSGCGDTGQYLSISTGYRKAQKPENASKVEIWLAPWFLVNKNLSSMAKHLQPIMGNWDAAAAPVGLLWTWGGWGNEDVDAHRCEGAPHVRSAHGRTFQVSFLN